MKTLRFARRFLAVAALATPVLAQGNVWVVDWQSGPGTDFTDLTDAFWATASGDVLLVRPGYYSLFAIADDRELTLQADGSGVVLSSYFVVRNLSAEKRVVVRGIAFQNSTIEIDDNDGIVWLEDCYILADQYGGSGPVAALVVMNSRIVLKGAYIHGSMPYGFHNSPPTHGLYLSSSTASVANVTIYGGDGQDTSYPDFPGAHAISAYDSTLVLSNADLHGGAGFSQPGGSGLTLAGGTTAWLRTVGASGGSGTPAGEATTTDASSSLTILAGPSRDLTVSSPARVGEDMTVTVQGVPGEAVMLRTGFRPALAFDPVGAFRLIDPVASQTVLMGIVPASGTLTLTTPVPALGSPSVEIFLQARHLRPRVSGLMATGVPGFRGELGPGSEVLLLGVGY